jgi:hypothetical protein
MRMNIFARGQQVQTRGRKIEKIHRTVAVLAGSVEGINVTTLLNFKRTHAGKFGVLLLDEYNSVAITERMKKGKSDAQMHADVWCPGPRHEKGYYLSPVEECARNSFPRSMAGRRSFVLSTQQDFRNEMHNRILVDPEEVGFLEPELLLLSREDQMRKANFDGIPSVILMESGRKARLRAATAGTVTKVQKSAVTVKSPDGQFRVMSGVPGMVPARGLKAGSKVRKDQPLFRLASRLDDLPADVAYSIIGALRSKIYVPHQGRDLVRLGAVDQVPHYCLRCGTNNGQHVNASLICPCGNALGVSPRLEGGVHMSYDDIKPDTTLSCPKCLQAFRAEVYRKHRTCKDCGGAAVPALKNAYALCNGRHYELEPGVFEGGSIQHPSEVSFTKRMLRKYRENGVDIAQLVRDAKWSTHYPRMSRIA